MQPLWAFSMKRAFTLIEVLVVLVILMLLLTLGSKIVGYARAASKKAKAHVEMSAIEIAVKSYFSTYGRLPVESGQHGMPDVEPSDDFSRTVFRILFGESLSDNPREIVFLEASSGSSEDGLLCDPWGEPYLLVLDTAYDGSIEYEGELVARRVGVVAVGLYKQNEEISVEDLLKSWL